MTCTTLTQVRDSKQSQLFTKRYTNTLHYSGGFRKGGSATGARSVSANFGGCHAHFRSRWKSELNISKQL